MLPEDHLVVDVGPTFHQARHCLFITIHLSTMTRAVVYIYNVYGVPCSGS